MALAEDVLNENGVVLVCANVQLTEFILESLARKKIRDLSVIHEDDRTPEQIAAEREQLTQRIEHIFRDSRGVPVMEELFNATLYYRLSSF
jgi:hypothetical protein